MTTDGWKVWQPFNAHSTIEAAPVPASARHKPMMNSRKAAGVAACVVTVLIWVGFIVVARAMAHRTLTPFDIGFVRFVAAALVLVPWGWLIVRRRRVLDPHGVKPAGAWLGISPLDFRRSALVGLVGGIGYTCLTYSGFYFAPASHASVLLPGMLPLWTAALAWALLGTRVSPRGAVGLSLIALAALLVGARASFATLAMAPPGSATCCS
jgi:drug/metabolite transporter (DMT)-like permease